MMFDLEIWLIGTPTELDAAARALAGIGRVIHHGTRTALAGADTGRWRIYARISVTGAYRPVLATADSTIQSSTLPDLAA
jgi:hypothetical protein